MQQTFFIIPHFLFEGWLLGAWLIIGILILGYLATRFGVGEKVGSFAIVYAMVAAIIYFVLPQLEIVGIDPANPAGAHVKLGLAIRGYGFFMLLGISSGIGLVLLRCWQIGLDPDKMLTLMFWIIVAGIIGARLFYIIQKWDEFQGETTAELFTKLLDMTKGGLVVYGSLFGAMVATAIYLWRTGLSFGKVADVLAPAFMIGLAFGRIGCLMNGCCYGGVCNTEAIGLNFPPGSPPYVRQLASGDLLGMELNYDEKADYRYEILSVVEGGLADQAGLQKNDRISMQIPDSLDLKAAMTEGVKLDSDVVIYKQDDAVPILIPHQRLPRASLPTHPTQIYSSINAALLCTLLWFYYPFRRREGEVFGLLLILYSIGRFLLETIRKDELGQFGTALTISQWVSVVVIIIGFGLFAWFRNHGQPPVAELAAG